MSYFLVNFQALNYTNGTVLTAGPSGNMIKPNYFDTKFVSNGDITFNSTRKTALFSTTAAGQCQLRRTSGMGVARLAAEIEGYYLQHPTANVRLFEFRNAADSSYLGKLNINTTGKIFYENAANATVYTSTTTLPINAGFRVYAGLEPGTTTSNGKIQISIYTASDGKSTTTSETPYSVTNGNAGTGLIGAGYLGWGSGGPQSIEFRNVQMNDPATLGAIGPLILDPLDIINVETYRRYLDFSTSTGTGRTISVVPYSGPTVTFNQTGEVFWFQDDPSRVQPIVIDVTLTDAGSNSITERFTIKPAVKRIGPLIKLTDVWK